MLAEAVILTLNALRAVAVVLVHASPHVVEMADNCDHILWHTDVSKYLPEPPSIHI